MTKAAQAMRKAWEIFKAAGIRTMDAWRVALRQAWAQVKKEAVKMVEAVALKGLDLVRGLSETDLPTIVTEAHSGWSKG